MVNKSGDIGTHAETAVVRVLRLNGFGLAERKVKGGAGRNVDLGDITGTLGLTWQVKGGNYARRITPEHEREWLQRCEEQRVAGDNDLGILVAQRKGYGYPRAAQWWAILHNPGDLAFIVAESHRTFHHIPPPHRTVRDDDMQAPVRMTLADLLPWLRLAGYGDALR